MQLTSAQKQSIQRAIGEYLNDPASIDLTTDLAVLARIFNALPTYADIGVALLVLNDGTVLAFSTNQVWDEASEYREESDPNWLRIAYQRGAERYPTAREALQALADHIAN